MDLTNIPVNICYFCSVSTFNSGMPISTFKLIKHFSSNIVFKVFCVFPSDGELPERVRECGVEVVIIPFQRIRRGFSFLPFIATWFSTLIKFSLFIRKNKINIVHFSDLIDLPYYPSLIFSNAKCIAHIRMNIEHIPLRIFYKIWSVLFCKKIICISNSVKNHAGLRKSNKAVIVYNPGPDPDLFKFDIPKKLPFGFDKEKSNIISIANFRPVKGLENFIEMASIVESNYPDKTHYIMVGDRLSTHIEYFKMLQNLINKHLLFPKFTILENVNHETIPSLIAHSYALVHLPNYQEGFGGVILEAMAMRTPVIAFDSGGISECFTHNVSGYLVTQYDVNLAADRLIQLLKNPKEHNQMSTNAGIEVKKFSYSKHFEEINQIYNGLMK